MSDVKHKTYKYAHRHRVVSQSPYRVSWFSAGVSSAVATMIAIDEIDEVIYTHIDDQHEDSMRFVRDCEDWFGKPITILQSKYKSVESVWMGLTQRVPSRRGMSPCTTRLKRDVRKHWESGMNCPLVYYWGLDSTESARADRLIDYMQNYEHRFPLIEKGISKECAHEILKASGIKRPYLYDLGFRNNNCLGCLKGSMGYWNQIRVHFPEVFKRRAECERIKGYSIVSRRNEDGGITNHWLDELDPRAGWDVPAICDDCGIMCEVYRIEPNVAGDTD